MKVNKNKFDVKNKQNVCAVIVSYNRKKLLIECLNSLFKQKSNLSCIYLVDNCSNDGTGKVLHKKGFINKIPPENNAENWQTISKNNKLNFYYLRTSNNVGGAGGFFLGLKNAYNLGYKWFWLMDDDVEPLKNALQHQLSFSDISKCIIPSKKDINGENLEWWGWLDLKTLLERPIPKKNYKKEYAEVNTVCFEGVLIHRDIVKKIGYPEKKFFIYGDDVTYGFKASLYTKNIYLLKPTFIKKLNKKNFKKRYGKYFPFASHSLSYYLMRNYLLKAKIIKQASPDKLNMINVYLFHFYYFLKQIFKSLLIEYDIKKIFILTKGFLKSFTLK